MTASCDPIFDSSIKKRPHLQEQGYLFSSHSSPPLKKFHLYSELEFNNVTSEDDLNYKTLLAQNNMLVRRLQEMKLMEINYLKKIETIENSMKDYKFNSNYVLSVWKSFNETLSLKIQELQKNESFRSDSPSLTTINDSQVSKEIPTITLGSSFEQVEVELKFLSDQSSDLINRLSITISNEDDKYCNYLKDLKIALTKFDSTNINLAFITEVSQLTDQLIVTQGNNERIRLLLASSEKLSSESIEKYSKLSFEFSHIQEKCINIEEENTELKQELNKLKCKFSRLQNTPSQIPHTSDMDSFSFEDKSPIVRATSDIPFRICNSNEKLLNTDDDWKKIAEGRLQELSDMNKKISDLKIELESIMLKEKFISDSDVKQSPLYKLLQTQYTLLCADNVQLKNYCDELKSTLNNYKQQLVSQLDELFCQHVNLKRDASVEISRLEIIISQLKKEADLSKIEYDCKIAAGEQAIAFNSELNSTIQSLNTNASQLKYELARYKKQFSESQNKADKLQLEKSNEAEKFDTKLFSSYQEISELKNQSQILKIKLKDLEEEEGEVKDSKKVDHSSSVLAYLKDFTEQYNKDLIKMREYYENRILIKTQCLKDEICYLRSQLQSKKQEQDIFINEMEVTGQAYEEEQDRVSKLLQQLKEKDDANFKLMSERISSNLIQKRSYEDKETLQSKFKALESEIVLIRETNSKSEERCSKLEHTINALEQENSLKSQIMDAFKRKSHENAKQMQENKFRLDEALNQMKEVEKALQSKTAEYESDLYRFRRTQEELIVLKRKGDKQKKLQLNVTDEILMEEVKNLKSELMCPCCSLRKKDHVLTKCFHVFCGDCIKTRYETRQRKCPKCNANFGISDWHKIYLT